MDINIPDISKPATVLIEKISDAIGGLAAPWQIVRMSNAKAEADRIQAESQIRITDLQHRAFYRFLEEEAKKQANMEEIIRRALPLLNDDSEPAHVETDWITDFFDKCRLISDEEMQFLWSRILAGEANAPGSFSKRTISFLSFLDKSDAQIFTQLCTFGWEIGRQVVPLVYDPENELYEKYGITASSLKHLDDIGLIQFANEEPFRIFSKTKTDLPIKLTAFYYEKPTHIELSGQSGYILVNSHERYFLHGGYVRLTKVGR